MSDHKSGYVNIIGVKCWKVYFNEQLVGEKLSIVTSKAQTTDIEF